MDSKTRLGLIKEVGEEIITEDELKHLLGTGQPLIAYDGFEPSGTGIHIAQGLLRAININKMTKAGCKFKMLVADWHAWANNKMGGNLEHIQEVGKYLIEVWKSCGMDLDKVEFIWSSDLVKDDEYWKKVMQIARNSTIKRIIRCGQIMGRKENDVLQASQILYPCMQCADIFHLKANITQLGMDQRKVNMLAREIGPTLGLWKPVVVSHHMLMGLSKPPEGLVDPVERAIAMKMSKSMPDSAIFMTDPEDVIARKINGAYCPEGDATNNPVLEYCRYIIFELLKEGKKPFNIDRPQKYGGPVSFETYAELEKTFREKRLHPMDLKKATGYYMNALLEPVRGRLEKNVKAKKLADEIKSFKVTR
jgi:tyrosyl-tRNA synthetase